MNERVAVIGAGPAGLVAAKFLLDQGLQPIVFEQSGGIGGQWHLDNPASGVWSGMPTNTSRIMTRFSDLDHPPDVPVFPRAEQVHAYLTAYVRRFGLERVLQLNTRVDQIERGPDDDWLIRMSGPGGEFSAERFKSVIIATGRFSHGRIPPIPGLENCTATIRHSHDYSGAGPFSGTSVLVAGGAISALEIASDLALNGTAKVTASYRGQRYVIGKLADNVPTDHLHFSLCEALLAESLDAETNAARMRDFALATMGSPDAYGAFMPAPDLRKAGVTKCDDFLPLLAAGKIRLKPWMRNLTGDVVEFEDGTADSFDQIIFGTGYGLDLPFLEPGIRKLLALDAEHIALYRHTFHPELPGLAVLGFYNQVGPYFPVLELQARWIARVLGGRIKLPSKQTMQAGLDDYFAGWDLPQKIPMHQLALLFSREMGAQPEPGDAPGRERAVMFGPLSSTAFRLRGPDYLPHAAETLSDEARRFGMEEQSSFSPEELALLNLIRQQPASSAYSP